MRHTDDRYFQHRFDVRSKPSYISKSLAEPQSRQSQHDDQAISRLQDEELQEKTRSFVSFPLRGYWVQERALFDKQSSRQGAGESMIADQHQSSEIRISNGYQGLLGSINQRGKTCYQVRAY